MRYLLILSFFCLKNFWMLGQSTLPAYTQYLTNNLLINSAVAGVFDENQIKWSWRGFGSGINNAPQNYYLSANFGFGKTENWGHGLSAIITSDQGGILKYNSYQIGYAFNFIVKKIEGETRISPDYEVQRNPNTSIKKTKKKDIHLSLGLQTQTFSSGLNISKLNNTNLNDRFIRNIDNSTHIDFGAALWLYSSKFYSGVSVTNVVSGLGTNRPDVSNYLLPHIFVTGGYRFDLGNDTKIIGLTPSLMWKKTLIPESADIQISDQLDINLIIDNLLISGLWFSTSYRTQGQFALGIGFIFPKAIDVSYTYNYISNNIGLIGVHEMVATVRLGEKSKKTDFNPVPWLFH